MYDWTAFPPAIIILITSTALAGVLVYYFDKTIALKKVMPDLMHRKHIERILGICTASHLFLVPTAWFYTV